PGCRAEKSHRTTATLRSAPERRARSRTMTARSRRRPPLLARCQQAAILTGLILLCTACATPIGVTLGSTQDVYRSATGSVLSTGRLSAQSEQTLRRHGLDERFAKEPEAVIAELRGDGTGLSRSRLYTLAELSFFHAERTHRQDYYLASAVYAYAFMAES